MMTERHGSPQFYSLLEEMAETHDKKSHDYASDAQPFANYHFAGMVSGMFSYSAQDAGFAGRLAEKIYRIASLEGSGKTPKNETIEDTERDIAVIATLWMASRRELRNLSNEVLKFDIPDPNQPGVGGGFRNINVDEISAEVKMRMNKDAMGQIKGLTTLLTKEGILEVYAYFHQLTR